MEFSLISCLLFSCVCCWLSLAELLSFKLWGPVVFFSGLGKILREYKWRMTWLINNNIIIIMYILVLMISYYCCARCFVIYCELNCLKLHILVTLNLFHCIYDFYIPVVLELCRIVRTHREFLIILKT